MNRATTLICLAVLAAVCACYAALFYALGLKPVGFSHACMAGTLAVMFTREAAAKGAK